MFAFLDKKKAPLFLIRILCYEFWPVYVLYFPVIFYWLYFAIRSGSVTFFTAVNPGFKIKGFLRESKIDILNLIAEEYLPKTGYVSEVDGLQDIRKLLKQKKIFFPFICKPNIGERGRAVCIVRNFDELNSYLLSHESAFIIQEYINYEIELGIFFCRNPKENLNRISSIVQKEFLQVTGDGVSSIENLIQQSARARFQEERLRKKLGDKIASIPANGEKIILEPIGNHCRGTKFIDANHLNSPTLLEVITKVTDGLKGYNFGRLDIRVKSIDDLYQGKNIKVLEVNGIWSEPAHIYDPQHSLWYAYKNIFSHHKVLFEISKINHRKNIPYTPLKEVLIYR